MADVTMPNRNWTVANEEGQCPNVDLAHLALLMDIRRELQTLNWLLACPRFMGIPTDLWRARVAVEALRKERKARRAKR